MSKAIPVYCAWYRSRRAECADDSPFGNAPVTLMAAGRHASMLFYNRAGSCVATVNVSRRKLPHCDRLARDFIGHGVTPTAQGKRGVRRPTFRMGPWSTPPATWAEVVWPDWVPEKVREQVSGFWSNAQGRSPKAYTEAIRYAYTDAPEFGEVATLRTLGGGFARGRFVYCWNNIGRLVDEVGIVHSVSTPYGSWDLEKRQARYDRAEECARRVVSR